MSITYLGLAAAIVVQIRAARLVLAGQYRPQMVSWTLWAAIPLIAAAVALAGGAGSSVVSLLAASAGPMTVIAAAFMARRRSPLIWTTGPVDVLCVWLTSLSLLMWVLLHNANGTVALLVAANTAATVPFWRKAWRDPSDEPVSVYLVGLLNACLGLIALDAVAVATAAFLLLLVTLNCVSVALVSLRPMLRPTVASPPAVDEQMAST